MQSNIYRYAKNIVKMVNVLLLKVSSETESKLIQKLDALVMVCSGHRSRLKTLRSRVQVNSPDNWSFSFGRNKTNVIFQKFRSTPANIKRVPLRFCGSSNSHRAFPDFIEWNEKLKYIFSLIRFPWNSRRYRQKMIAFDLKTNLFCTFD